MFHKRNLISLAIGTAFLFTVGTSAALAADTAKEHQHQHHSGKTTGHSHGDAKAQSADQHDHHGHQCEHMGSVDTDQDGKISKEEFMKHHEALFDKKDANKDGFIDQSEMHRMMDQMHKHEHGKQQKDGAHTHGDAKK